MGLGFLEQGMVLCRQRRLQKTILLYLLAMLAMSFAGKEVFIAALSFSAIALLVLFVFFQPKLALMLHVFLIPLARYVPAVPFLSFSADTLIEILLVIFIVVGVVLGRRKLFQCRQNVVLALFLAVALLSLSVAGKPSDAMVGLTELSHALVLFFLVSNLVENRRDVLNIFSALLLSGLVASLFSFRHLLLGWQIKGAVQGLLGESNRTALFFLTLMPIALFFFLKQKSFWRKAVHFGVSAVLFFAMFISFSRASLLAFGIVFFALLLRAKQRAKIAVSLLLLGLVILSLMPLPFIQYGLTASGFTEYTRRELDRSVSERLVLWKYGLEVASQRPLLGTGIGNVEDTFSNVIPPDVIYWRPYKSVHNLFLLILVEMGVFALLLFLLLLFFTFQCLQRAPKKQGAGILPLKDAIFFSLLAFLIHCLFINPFDQHVFWIMLGLAAIAGKQGVILK